MPVTVTAILTSDIRFPTSLALDGSDAINVDPDHSAAYVILKTDLPDGLEGRGLTFTTSGGSSSVGRAAAFQAQCQVMPGG